MNGLAVLEPWPSADKDERTQPEARTLPSPETVQAACMEAFGMLAQHASWLGPLLEAALLCPPELRKPAEILTTWCGDRTPVGSAEDADPEKHAAYVEHMRDVINEACPFLLPLLDAAGALLLVSPGLACYTVRTRLGVPIDIPALVPFTHLTPFPPEEGEQVH